MKTIKVIESKKPKTKKPISKKPKTPKKTKAPTQLQTQTVIINTGSTRRQRKQVSTPPKIIPVPQMGVPIRMNNPVQPPIFINKDSNQLSNQLTELIQSLKVQEPEKIKENSLEKKKTTTFETQTEEFDEQRAYNKISQEDPLRERAVEEVRPQTLLGELKTSDYPSFTSVGTQTRTYRLGDLLRESKQENELSRLYSEREQILGRRAGPDPTPAIFSSQPPTTSLLSSVSEVPIFETKPPPTTSILPLDIVIPPPSLTETIEQVKIEEVVPIVQQSNDLPTGEGGLVEAPEPPPLEPPLEEQIGEEGTLSGGESPLLGFGGHFEPVKGLEELNLPTATKVEPEPVNKKVYLGDLPPIITKEAIIAQNIKENPELFPKQGQGLLGEVSNLLEEVKGTQIFPSEASTLVKVRYSPNQTTEIKDKWDEINARLTKEGRLAFPTHYINPKSTKADGRSTKRSPKLLEDIRSIYPEWKYVSN
jgi:hypothetical protein